jgi:hypothetical protein
MHVPDPHELRNSDHKRRDAFYRNDDLIEGLWNPVKGNNQHRDGERKRGIDKDFDASHVNATQPKTTVDRTLREKVPS